MHRCYHYMTKVEPPLEDCIGMLHHGSNAGYSEIHAYTLNGKWMSPYGSIHCAVYSPAFRAEISLIPVTYDSGKTQIYLRIM